MDRVYKGHYGHVLQELHRPLQHWLCRQMQQIERRHLI
jgi:hypothetical protein